MNADQLRELTTVMLKNLPMCDGMRALTDIMTQEIYARDPKYNAPRDVLEQFGFTTEQDIDMLIDYVRMVAGPISALDIHRAAEQNDLQVVPNSLACAGWIDGFCAGLLVAHRLVEQDVSG